MRRVVPVLISLALVAALGYAFWPKPLPVDIESVTRGPMEVTVDEEGKTRIKEHYMVSAPLGGRLRRIVLDPGDEVVAGQTLLAVIEPNDPALLDARALAEATARVKAAEASVQQSVPNLERARTALEFAQSEFRRAKQLAERNNLAQQELENAELALRVKTEEYKSAQFAEQIAKFEEELAQAALIRVKPSLANENAGSSDSPKIEIHSPINGRVLHVKEENAVVVMPGAPLIELGDTRDLEIEIDVLSSDAVKIQPGALVRLEHWGGELPLLGRVRLVEPAAFTKISALGVEEQRVNVVVDFEDDPSKRNSLGDGFRVEARIVVWRNDSVLKVPANALFRQGKDWAVFRVENNRAILRKIKIGQNNGLEAEVLEGLSEGDRVVAHPSDKIVDGVRVTAR
ncbi:MAG: HlyD family efflux transporter periplasmic adaptor subunit [Planctomycetota bacterium]